MQDFIKQLVAAFTGTAEPKQATGDYVALPDGYIVEDLERYQERPRRIKQSLSVATARSFIKYVSDFGTSYTVVFANLKDQQFKAVLDYHDPVNGPSWCEHQVLYSCPIDIRWKTWKSHDGKALKQVDFARFIEDNLVDIVSPQGAEILAIAKELQAKKAIEFKSGQNLSNGDIQFTYNETTNGSAGQLSIPETFTLGIPVYEGGAKYEVIARLRYRISDGGLALWYDLLRPERMEEDAFKEVETEINTALTSQVTFFN